MPRFAISRFTRTKNNSFPWSVCILILIMLLRVSFIRCGWVTYPLQGPRQGRSRASWVIGEAFTIGRNPTLRMKRPFHSSHTLFAKWDVGDSVNVQKNGSKVAGYIHEARGSGWFSVQLDGGDGTLMKCRSNQMELRKEEAFETDGTFAVSVQTFSPSSLPRPIIHPESGKKPDFPPPPPTIYNLDKAVLDRFNVTNQRDQELLEQVEHHSRYEKWVVFTDLHCSQASLNTCLQVLTRVHELAVERNAGVLFLGDFWHHRGTLRVDCLNSVLDHFRDWTVPMVMIPGNHDQVTLNGFNHGLTPLEHSYRVGNVSGPLIFSHPSVFRNALFVPHIRDIATMESVLQSPAAREAQALFVHAEVTGALMNDLIVSTDGIPPASFPTEKRIYSGHFHKPHTVKASNGGPQIEYLGSPYETSLSEAQQAKTLAILDSNWNCLEYIPIDIGRRHFKIESWEELLDLQLKKNKDPSQEQSVRPGDRIVASIPKSDIEVQVPEINTHLKDLRSKGVMVEIREIKEVADQAMGSSTVGGEANQLEEMSPESTWRAYIAEEEENRKTLSRELALDLTKTGLDILNELMTSDESNYGKDESSTELSLTKVTVEGFGPFREKTTYPLSNRGFVLLKGTNNDGGSDSNGSGKSSLAMAALWALTGSMDPRRSQDGKVSDIIHDEAKTARVTLEGFLNGKPFSISRSKMTQKNGLVFLLDGQDLTTQSARETQALIEEYLGVSLSILSRTMFHGQHAINELLEATDTKLKEELALLVPLDLWQNAATLSRTKSREAGKRVSELEGMVAMRSQDKERLSLKQKQALFNVQQREEKMANLEAEARQAAEFERHEENFDFETLESDLSAANSELDELNSRMQQIKADKENEMTPIVEKLQTCQQACDVFLKEIQAVERQEYVATLDLEASEQRCKELETKWSFNFDSSDGKTPNLQVPDLCPTCGQSIDDEHSHAEFEAKMTEEIESIQKKREEAKRELEQVTGRLGTLKQEFQSHEADRKSAEENLQQVADAYQHELDQIETLIGNQLCRRDLLSEKMTLAAKRSQQSLKREAALANIQVEKSGLTYSLESLASIKEEMDEVQARLDDMNHQASEQRKASKRMAELTDRFGARGVQTFVLQNVVDVLQACSRTYLDDLSDGSQRLELSLDAGDRISRRAFVIGSDGAYKERPLATLSGGQWRRCSLALTFGFAELVARRGRFRPSLCVLDEPLTHLDRSGRVKVGEVIRKMLRRSDSDGLTGFGLMGMSTVLIILQDLAAEEIDDAFDSIDEVVKENSASTVKVDGQQTYTL